MESVRLRTLHPLASSLGIHLLLLALFLVFQLRIPVRPWGANRFGDPTLIEVSEIAGVRRTQPAVKSRTVAVPSKNSSATQAASQPVAAQVSPQQSAGSFGKAEGAAVSGDLGSADGVKLSARDRYLADLRTTLEARKKYPTLSRRMSESGRVLVRFQIARDGQFSNITVLKSSAYERLNSAALALVQELGRYRAFPESLSAAALFVEIPIDYVLD